MREEKWVQQMAARLTSAEIAVEDARHLEFKVGLRLPYGHEIRSYEESSISISDTMGFRTDLAIVERNHDNTWKPRVVVEAKVARITTHDAITYSQKAAAHRAVHPYLRYGILLGNREHKPLPGRLYRHGQEFDFMISFRTFMPTDEEMAAFLELLQHELEASRIMEKIVYESRQKDRDRYHIFHRRLEVKQLGGREE